MIRAGRLVFHTVKQSPKAAAIVLHKMRSTQQKGIAAVPSIFLMKLDWEGTASCVGDRKGDAENNQGRVLQVGLWRVWVLVFGELALTVCQWRSPFLPAPSNPPSVGITSPGVWAGPAAPCVWNRMLQGHKTVQGCSVSHRMDPAASIHQNVHMIVSSVGCFQNKRYK